MFAANYLSFEVKPSPEGGLTDGTQVEVQFRNRAMFEFVSLLEKSRERAIYMKRQTDDEEEGLRQYYHSQLAVNFADVSRSTIHNTRGIKFNGFGRPDGQPP